MWIIYYTWCGVNVEWKELCAAALPLPWGVSTKLLLSQESGQYWREIKGRDLRELSKLNYEDRDSHLQSSAPDILVKGILFSGVLVEVAAQVRIQMAAYGGRRPGLQARSLPLFHIKTQVIQSVVMIGVVIHIKNTTTIPPGPVNASAISLELPNDIFED